MRPYSQDLRERVVHAIEKKLGTQSEVAELFGVSRTFVKKMLRLRREEGRLDPKPHGGGHVSLLDADLLELLRQHLSERPDATLEELRDHLAERAGVRVSTATISRALKREQLPRGRVRRHSVQMRSRPEQRHEGATT